MTAALVETEAIILRKIPYSDSSIVAAAITPRHGRVDFLIKGAMRLGRAQFPVADIFRELRVAYFDTDSDALCVPRGISLLQANDAVAARPDVFLHCCACAAFLLANVRHGVEVPRSYQAFASILAEPFCFPVPPLHALALVFMDEGGFLPQSGGAGGAALRRMLRDIAAARPGQTAGRHLSEEAAAAWTAWIHAMVSYHGLAWPDRLLAPDGSFARPWTSLARP